MEWVSLVLAGAVLLGSCSSLFSGGGIGMSADPEAGRKACAVRVIQALHGMQTLKGVATVPGGGVQMVVDQHCNIRVESAPVTSEK